MEGAYVRTDRRRWNRLELHSCNSVPYTKVDNSKIFFTSLILPTIVWDTQVEGKIDSTIHDKLHRFYSWRTSQDSKLNFSWTFWRVPWPIRLYQTSNANIFGLDTHVPYWTIINVSLVPSKEEEVLKLAMKLHLAIVQPTTKVPNIWAVSLVSVFTTYIRSPPRLHWHCCPVSMLLL